MKKITLPQGREKENNMNVLIGIDIGGSTTKIVGFTADQKLIGTLKVNASDQLACMYGALGSFLHNSHLTLHDVSKIVLTGVGASFISSDLYGIPTCKAPEFEAIGRGGLRLAKVKQALIVSMGTGTAFVRASAERIEHAGGSGVGGGTLCGLASMLLNERDVAAVSKLAETGDAGGLDLLIRDIFCGDVPSLPLDLTASNFGRLKSGASEPDIAAALFNLVFQTVGMLAVFACQNSPVKDIVLVGSLAELPQAKQIFGLMSRLYGVNFIIPPEAVFATAIGAVLPLFTAP